MYEFELQKSQPFYYIDFLHYLYGKNHKTGPAAVAHKCAILKVYSIIVKWDCLCYYIED